MNAQAAAVFYGSVLQNESHSDVMPGEMSVETFFRFREFVTKALGIKMPDAKRTMLQSRLQKRLRALGIDTYEDYYTYVFSIQGQEVELPHMIDAVTTNKTDFFREPKHFQYLVDTALPVLMNFKRRLGRRHVRLWSAGCASGAEPYTLAMVMSEYAEQHPGVQCNILATDISHRVLKKAIHGVYDAEMVSPVPRELRKKYLLKSKDSKKQLVRIVPNLRAMVKFSQLNFMNETYGVRRNVDAVFCRNVLIYFDRPTQEAVINRLCCHLDAGGYLFIGHSETLNGLSVPLTQVSPTIYRKKGHE